MLTTRRLRQWTGCAGLALSIAPATVVAQATRTPAVRDTAFAATIQRISEPGGYFDSDNLISNETSYLHVITRLKELGVRGGAYIGVGPDQNYSYIAAIRPQVAFIMDIRRDNALQHLMYKALFERSRNRAEYVFRWLGRRIPQDIERWTSRPILDILAWAESNALDSAQALRERQATLALAASYGVPLGEDDRSTILRFHETFMREGLELRFSSFRRFNSSMYPSLRSLILQRDLKGEMSSYLGTEDAWRFVKRMHAEGKILPVVGDLGGDKTFPALARELRARSLVLSALYTSNAEMYVWRDGLFPRFAETVTQLPIDARSVIIRSYFDRSGGSHPLAVRGHTSVQLLQRVEDFVRHFRGNRLESYWSIVSLDAR